MSELLSAYLDQELNWDELNRVNKLLATSEEARLELENLKKAKAFLNSAPRVQVPYDLVKSLEMKYRHKAETERWVDRMFTWPRVWFLAGSTATTVLAIALWLNHEATLNRKIDLEPLLSAHEKFKTVSTLNQGAFLKINSNGTLTISEKK